MYSTRPKGIPPLNASAWSFVGYFHYVIDEDEVKQWWEHTCLSHPCLDPEEIRNVFFQNQAALKSFIELYEWDDLLRTVMSLTFQRVSRCLLSKAILKSKKLTKKGAFHSIHCSTFFLRAKIWSEQPLPALNPACCSRILWSTIILILLRNTRQNTLLGIDSKVILRELSQTEISPFLGIFTIKPFLQSSGISSRSHTSLKKCLAIFQGSDGVLYLFDHLCAHAHLQVLGSRKAVTVFRVQGWLEHFYSVRPTLPSAHGPWKVCAPHNSWRLSSIFDVNRTVFGLYCEAHPYHVCWQPILLPWPVDQRRLSYLVLLNYLINCIVLNLDSYPDPLRLR